MQRYIQDRPSKGYWQHSYGLVFEWHDLVSKMLKVIISRETLMSWAHNLISMVLDEDICMCSNVRIAGGSEDETNTI